MRYRGHKGSSSLEKDFRGVSESAERLVFLFSLSKPDCVRASLGRFFKNFPNSRPRASNSPVVSHSKGWGMISLLPDGIMIHFSPDFFAEAFHNERNLETSGAYSMGTAAHGQPDT